jgi:hypothetical protein
MGHDIPPRFVDRIAGALLNNFERAGDRVEPR